MSYKKEWYNKKRQTKINSANALIPIVLDLLKPSSVVDVGCGDGTWLSVLSQKGITDYLGIDGNWIDKELLQIPSENFKVADLTKPLELHRKYDLAVTLEVAEHLPPDSAEIFVDSLTDCSNCILFSAAVPYQRGTKHFNEQWQSYWAKLFDSYGFVAVDIIRNRIWDNRNILPFYKQNIVLYIREDDVDDSSIYKKNIVKDLNLLNKVHPEIFEMKMQSYEKSKKIRSTLNRLGKRLYNLIIGNR